MKKYVISYPRVALHAAWVLLGLTGCALDAGDGTAWPSAAQGEAFEDHAWADAGPTGRDLANESSGAVERNEAVTKSKDTQVGYPGLPLAYTGAEYGVDRPGADLRNMPTTSASACRSACVADTKCAAFSYVPPGVQGSGAVCWLKARVPGRRHVSNGIASGIVREGGFEYGIDRAGADYNNFYLSAADPKLCKQACEADRFRCRSFTYVQPGPQGLSARCWLKSSEPRLQTNARTISGLVPPYVPAPPCTEVETQKILEPATASAGSIYVRCSPSLAPRERVTKILRFFGAASSGVTLECNGATIASNTGKDERMVQIQSDIAPFIVNGEPYEFQDPAKIHLCAFHPEDETCTHPVAKKLSNGYYSVSRPADVTIRGCNIIGNVRIWGLGRNGEDGYMWFSSRDTSAPGHVARARNAAPTRILFDQVTVTGAGGNRFYVSPGVTYLTLRYSEIAGSSTASGIYLDAESAYNVIESNTIRANAERHQMAVDASSYNTISHNYFSGLSNGGIYLYRNCGEHGVVRYSRPSYNTIHSNYFYYNNYGGNNPGIFVGARNGGKGYCDDDKNSGVPNSSASSNRDYAQYNDIQHNRFEGVFIIREGSTYDSPNTILNNRLTR